MKKEEALSKSPNFTRVNGRADPGPGIKNTQNLPDKGGKNYGIYEVERILCKKMISDKAFYLVKWKGYTEEYNTFEPIENMSGALKLVDEFEKSLVEKKGSGEKKSLGEKKSGSHPRPKKKESRRSGADPEKLNILRKPRYLREERSVIVKLESSDGKKQKPEQHREVIQIKEKKAKKPKKIGALKILRKKIKKLPKSHSDAVQSSGVSDLMKQPSEESNGAKGQKHLNFSNKDIETESFAETHDDTEHHKQNDLGGSKGKIEEIAKHESNENPNLAEDIVGKLLDFEASPRTLFVEDNSTSESRLLWEASARKLFVPGQEKALGRFEDDDEAESILDLSYNRESNSFFALVRWCKRPGQAHRPLSSFVDVSELKIRNPILLVDYFLNKIRKRKGVSAF